MSELSGADPAAPPAAADPPPPRHGRAGRNLPAAISVGAGLLVYIVATLLYFKPGFVVLLTAALGLGVVELASALRRHAMRAELVPILLGTVAISAGSYIAGQQRPVVFSTASVLLASLALTVLGCLIWRIPRGAPGYVTDVAASLFITGYVPMLGSFAALMLAAGDGSARFVTFLLVVVMSDIGGYLFGVLIGRHPMAPTISPKKSWEGFVGSMVLGTAAGVAMTTLVLQRPFWVGLLLGVVLVAVGTCGDLIESMVKRDLGIKDMSSILPGHGGVMDRLDSLLVAAPVAWLIMYLLVPGG